MIEGHPQSTVAGVTVVFHSGGTRVQTCIIQKVVTYIVRDERVNRRTLLASTGTALVSSVAGCLDWGSDTDSDVAFETSDEASRSNADDKPTVTVEDSNAIVTGTMIYGPGSCGTIELAHSEYTPKQNRLDLLVVSANEPQANLDRCSVTDDAVGAYRIEVSGWDLLRYVSVTEHHYNGEIYSREYEGDI